MGFVCNRHSFRGRSLAAALLGTTFLIGLAGPALADSHLESENDELRSKVEDLMQEVQILKNMVLQQNKKNMEQDESIAEQADQKQAKMVKSGKDKVSLKVYGQVNRMLLYASDGRDGRIFHADNDMSSTRVGFKGKAKMGGGWSAGTTVEAQMESNSSSKVNLQGDVNSGNEPKSRSWFQGRSRKSLVGWGHERIETGP